MKYLILTDIHGSSKYLKLVLNKVNDFDKIIILGDILYHGPRNDLPKDYNPKEVIKMLNSIKDSIVCVRGNCDSEVDQMVLDFPIMADYSILSIGNRTFFVTHGHKFNESFLPPMKGNDILLHGHTHIPVKEIINHSEMMYINPGSVSIPKDNSEHSYMIIEDNNILWKNLDGKIYMNYNIG
jgi:putative phosphoesterase